MEKKLFTIEKLINTAFYLCILILFIALNFADNPPGWVQQNPPVENRTVTDIKFLDSLNGWAVTDQGSAPDSAFILKTSDGGNNWIIQYRLQVGIFHALSMVNISTGYACGISSIGLVMKTTNEGINWTDLNFPGIQEFIDIDFINKDTGWVCDQTPLGGLWQTTNGGISWQAQAGGSINRVFFVNNNTGWYSRDNGQLYRTYNSGVTWNYISTPLVSYQIYDIFFTSPDTGWITYLDSVGIYKSTNGGVNWTPISNHVGYTAALNLFFLNSQKGWAGGGFNKINITKDGTIWGKQNAPIDENVTPFFIDTLHGWACDYGIIHTNDGGGPITYNSIKPISSNIPKDYLLYQNYPNPFNSSTKFKISIKSNGKSETANVKINLYDITGRVAAVLVNSYIKAGEYEISFEGSNFPSGVYFYTLIVDGKSIDTRKMVLLK